MNIYDIQASIFSRPLLSGLNDRLLHATLKARGYNNFKDDESTGEKFFVESILAKENPRVCIDIGANKGTYSKLLLKETNASVIAFEPNPSCFRELLKLQGTYQDRFYPINKGIGDCTRVADLNYSTQASAFASFSSEVNQVPYVNNDKVLKSEVITLDS